MKICFTGYLTFKYVVELLQLIIVYNTNIQLIAEINVSVHTLSK